jgi:hypothetical protein
MNKRGSFEGAILAVTTLFATANIYTLVTPDEARGLLWLLIIGILAGLARMAVAANYIQGVTTRKLLLEAVVTAIAASSFVGLAGPLTSSIPILENKTVLVSLGMALGLFGAPVLVGLLSKRLLGEQIDLEDAGKQPEAKEKQGGGKNV